MEIQQDESLTTQRLVLARTTLLPALFNPNRDTLLCCFGFFCSLSPSLFGEGGGGSWVAAR